MAKVIVSKEALTDLAHKVLQDRIDGIMIKNADYGDAWQENGPFNPVMRIKEKLTRVETLSDGREALVLDESVDSNIGEIWDYTLLYMLYRERNKIVMIPGQMSFAEVEAAKAAWEDILDEKPKYGCLFGVDYASGVDRSGLMRFDVPTDRTTTDRDGTTGDPRADAEQPTGGDGDTLSTGD